MIRAPHVLVHLRLGGWRHKGREPPFVGANMNTWGAWIPFVLSEMTEEGYYTDWNGNLTPIGVRYLAHLMSEKRVVAEQ